MQLNIYISVTGFMCWIDRSRACGSLNSTWPGTGWRAARTPPARRRRAPLAAGVAPLIAVLLLSAGGGGGRGPPPPPPPPAAGSEGRPLGGPRSDSAADAIAAATRFARGYLAFQAGTRAPGDVPSATPELHEGLKRL